MKLVNESYTTHNPDYKWCNEPVFKWFWRHKIYVCSCGAFMIFRRAQEGLWERELLK